MRVFERPPRIKWFAKNIEVFAFSLFLRRSMIELISRFIIKAEFASAADFLLIRMQSLNSIKTLEPLFSINTVLILVSVIF